MLALPTSLFPPPSRLPLQPAQVQALPHLNSCHLCPLLSAFFFPNTSLPHQSCSVSLSIGSSPDHRLSQRTKLINALSQTLFQHGTDQLPTSGTFAATCVWWKVGNLLAVHAAYLHRNLAALRLHRTAARRRVADLPDQSYHRFFTEKSPTSD